MTHPGDPPEGFPALPASGGNAGFVPWREDDVAQMCNTEKVEGFSCPCYVCGYVPTACFCRRCRRNLCASCITEGRHGDYASRCDFIIEGRSPD